MGGFYYDRLMGRAANTSGFSRPADKIFKEIKSLHPNNDPQRFCKNSLQCKHKHPIVFALDVTGSMGDWSKVEKY